jgi:hypothetical protein
MCDRCGNVFPESAEGSSVGMKLIMRRDPETGQRRQEQAPDDQCPPCADGTAMPVFPKSYVDPRRAIQGKATLVETVDATTNPE